MFEDPGDRGGARPPGGSGVSPPGANVPGYLLPLSILATVFCCLPTGIAAIVYSAQARSKSQVGDTAGASQAAKTAQMWLIISVVIGIVIAFVYVIFVILGAAGSSGY